MKTDVRVLRGSHRGRTGWISGNLEDRAARGITKAIVKFSDAPAELLAMSSLAAHAQPDLFRDGPSLPSTIADRSPAPIAAR